MVQRHKDVGINCIKYMLLFITAIFVITSALIISVGTTIYAIYHDVAFFLYDNFFSPAMLVIVIGIIMLFVSLFGCIGALKESTCMVNIFAVFLSIVLILELAAAIAAYSLRSQIGDMLDDKLTLSIPYYYESDEVQDSFDFIQSRLNCCGVDSYLDWGDVESPAGVSGIKIDNMTVPNSCCAMTRTELVGDLEVEQCTKLYANGCLPRVYYLIYQSAGLLGAGAMTIALIQFIGIVFSFSLARSIRRAKSERQRRLWEIQERVLNSEHSAKLGHEKIVPVVYVPYHGQSNA
ncbi:CD63 antigen-like [Achroia grisella]|uniref:CD63 antigen-like n=1 Tax=Achroia grisella TaxID=688607 RepID=UPI0027D2BA19|nr:CD63 antigen-like [Achroia grisella]